MQDTGHGLTRSLCLAKTLLAPVQAKSIPRLELDAALLCVRLAQLIKNAHPWTVLKVHFWTDAKDVLHWLRSSTRRYSAYVAHRVAHILSMSTVEQWHWTPTDQNPADLGTKWHGSTKKNDMWWHGPDFLTHSEEFWPDCDLNGRLLLEVRPILFTSCHKIRPVLVPDVHRFSSWTRFVHSTSYALKALRILRRVEFRGPLTDEDTRLGEAEIYLSIQEEMLQDKCLQSFLMPLAPFADTDGVLRMRGRIAKGNLPYDAPFPVILCQHPAVDLLVQHYHMVSNHQNTTAVINELRQRIIFPNMRAVIRRIVSRCRTCMNRRARPVLP